MDFTYGPLGFLSQQVLFYESTAALAEVYAMSLAVATFALLIHWSRKNFSLPIAILVSYVVGATAVAFVDAGDLIVVPAAMLGMLCIAQSSLQAQGGFGTQIEPRTEHELAMRQIGITILGFAGAVGLLVKFSGGVTIAVMLVAVVAAGNRHRIRDAAIAAGAFVGTVVVAWMATGNSPVNLPAFIRYAVNISGGYPLAMQLETGRTDQWWYALVGALAVAAFAVLSLRKTRGRFKYCSALLIVATFAWALKEGFVRHDAHDLILFGLMPVLLVTLPLPTSRWRPYLAPAIAFLIVLAWTAAGSVPPNVLGVIPDIRALTSDTSTIVSSASRTSTIDSARASMQNTYGLTSSQVGQLSGHSVAIQPWENTVAWAYPSIRWDPEPVLQSYSAYTPTLDQLDASFLSSGAAPDRILQQASAVVDGRYYFFEPPTTWVTMMCRYVQVDATGEWQVLRRVPDRCGTLRPIKQVSATFGQKIAVPRAPAGEAVVARFVGLPQPFGYTVSSLALKPPPASIVTSVGSFRFVVPTAGDLHLLRPSSTVGYAPAFDPSNIAWFYLAGGGVRSGAGTYSVIFYALPVSGT